MAIPEGAYAMELATCARIPEAEATRVFSLIYEAATVHESRLGARSSEFGTVVGVVGKWRRRRANDGW